MQNNTNRGKKVRKEKEAETEEKWGGGGWRGGGDTILEIVEM